MVDVLLTSEDMTVLGGPTSISLDIDLGAQGPRGTNIFTGQGKPTDPLVAETLPDILVNDLFINLKPSDDEYLFLYQYQSTDGILSWSRTLRLIPQTAILNTDIVFWNGRAITPTGPSTPPLPFIFFPLSLFFKEEDLGELTRDNFSIQYNIITENEVTDFSPLTNPSFPVIANPMIVSGMTIGPKTTVDIPAGTFPGYPTYSGSTQVLPIYLRASEVDDDGTVTPLGAGLTIDSAVVKKIHTVVTVV
jgi:hypothetical protein